MCTFHPENPLIQSLYRFCIEFTSIHAASLRRADTGALRKIKKKYKVMKFEVVYIM